MSWETFEETLIASSGPLADIRDMQRWDERGLETINDNFDDTFGEFSKSDIRIGTDTDAYRAKWVTFRQSCKDTAVQVGERRTHAGLPVDPNFEKDVGKALAWPTTPEETIPIPFPTRSFVKWTFDLFASVPKSLHEVSVLSHI